MNVGFANKEANGRGASWHATCSSGRKIHLISVFLSQLTPRKRLELSPSSFPPSASETSSVSSENTKISLSVFPDQTPRDFLSNDTCVILPRCWSITLCRWNRQESSVEQQAISPRDPQRPLSSVILAMTRTRSLGETNILQVFPVQ